VTRIVPAPLDVAAIRPSVIERFSARRMADRDQAIDGRLVAQRPDGTSVGP
jgi:hypothetical protein